MFLLATSSMMSFAMAFTGIPQAISSLIMGVTDNKLVILLLVNLVLLLVGMFMDVAPAILILHQYFYQSSQVQGLILYITGCFQS